MRHNKKPKVQYYFLRKNKAMIWQAEHHQYSMESLVDAIDVVAIYRTPGVIVM